jgi:hypothetical protein
MNKQWHAENPMPTKARQDERIRWRQEHQEHCACRQAPKSLGAARPDLFAAAKSRRTSTSI